MTGWKEWELQMWGRIKRETRATGRQPTNVWPAEVPVPLRGMKTQLQDTRQWSEFHH